VFVIFSGLYFIRVQITGCAAAFKSVYLIRVMDADKSWSRHLLHCKLAGKGFLKNGPILSNDKLPTKEESLEQSPIGLFLMITLSHTIVVFQSYCCVFLRELYKKM
jgi:hypothetical protein